jgi:hypothetical protein
MQISNGLPILILLMFLLPTCFCIFLKKKPEQPSSTLLPPYSANSDTLLIDTQNMHRIQPADSVAVNMPADINCPPPVYSEFPASNSDSNHS